MRLHHDQACGVRVSDWTCKEQRLRQRARPCAGLPLTLSGETCVGSPLKTAVNTYRGLVPISPKMTPNEKTESEAISRQLWCCGLACTCECGRCPSAPPPRLEPPCPWPL